MKNETFSNDESFNRRDFIKGSSLATLMAMMGGVEITAQDAPKVLAVPKADPNYKDKPVGPPVKMGVIGLGVWGKELVSTLSRLPNAPVVAVCETYESSLRRAGEAAPKAKKYKDHKELLADKEVQGVVVATPTHLHKDIVLDALAAGKHVYCEAPMAATEEDARAMAAAAKKADGLVFQVGHQNRANPQHHHVLNFARAGAMGKSLMAKGQWHKKQSWRRASPNSDREKALNWRLDPEVSLGLIGEIGIHQVDVANWFFNQLPTSVTGYGSIMHWDDGRQVPDTVMAVFEYRNGLRMCWDATLGNSFDGTYDIFYGTDSALMIREQKAWMFKEVDSPLLGWEVYARKEEFFQESGIALVANATKLLAQGKKPAEGTPDSDAPHRYSLEEFVANINEKKAPSCGYKIGLVNTILARKANEAVLKGIKIKIEKSWFEV